MWHVTFTVEKACPLNKFHITSVEQRSSQSPCSLPLIHTLSNTGRTMGQKSSTHPQSIQQSAQGVNIKIKQEEHPSLKVITKREDSTGYNLLGVYFSSESVPIFIGLIILLIIIAYFLWRARKQHQRQRNTQKPKIGMHRNRDLPLTSREEWGDLFWNLILASHFCATMHHDQLCSDAS